MKNKYNFEKEVVTIINKIEPRIKEVCTKFKTGAYNEATMFAFWIGIGGDLEDALTKIEKRKIKDGNNKRRK